MWWFYVLLLGVGAVIGVLLWTQWQKRGDVSVTGMNVNEGMKSKDVKKATHSSSRNSNNNDEPVIYELTEDDVPGLMEKEPNVLVMVYAEWCGYCKRMAPEFEKAARSLSRSGITCARLNSERNPRATEQLGVESFPITLHFHNGKLVQKLRGAMDAEELVTQVSTSP